MEDIPPAPARFRRARAYADVAQRTRPFSPDISSALLRSLGALDADVYMVDAAARVQRWGSQPPAEAMRAWDALGARECARLLQLCLAVLRDGEPRETLLGQAQRRALLEPVRDGPNVVATLVVLPGPPRDAGTSFVDAAVHELRTPVTAIKGYAQLALMRQRSENHELLERALRTIVEQADRLSGLIGDLGDASRLQRGCFELYRERFDLVPLLREGVTRAGNCASRHSFALASPGHCYGVWDRERVTQVLTHLLENAVKYSPAGGPVDVALAVDRCYAAVTVRDRGIGVTPEQQSHIFEPWSTAHDRTAAEYGGLGLGLSLCRAIIEQHGGGMWVDSHAAGGSVFGFRLPVTNDE